MAQKQIMNPLQAWSAGATWGTPSGDNEMTQTVAHLLNGSGATLYTGDIVCLDVTGTQAVFAASAGDPRVIGTVGGAEQDGSYYPAGSSNINLRASGGGAMPPELSPVVTASLGFTNGSGTVTYTGAAATDIGKQILTPYNSSTNANPQVYTVTAVTAGTGYTVSPTFNGTTGTFAGCTIQNAPSNLGPGWGAASAYPIGVQVPVVTAGYGRVNVNGVAAAVATDSIAGTSGSPVGARTAAGGSTAAQNGTFIATALEAYAARDTSLTAAGITGHDSVRALIGKF
jgi:hypothetical protein